MQTGMKRIMKSSGLLLIAAMVIAGCAEERDPINRVQPYALPKSFFIGDDYQDITDDPEFWGRNSVVDVGYGASQDLLFTSTIGQQVSRLKWQVTEDLLIARATYERIIGADGKGEPVYDKNGVVVGSETHDGIIVAAFPIEKHFDVVNSYNPTTGERINVLEENAYDRPWYERDYIRVNWSINMNTDSYDFDTLSAMGVYGGLKYEPMRYYVEDPNDKNAPFFDMENFYFDVTTKVFAKPGMIHIGRWGIDSFPACYLSADVGGGTAPAGNCNPVELTLRHSFRRVVDTDFEPVEYDGQKFTVAGGFLTDRYGYNREYGMTDQLWHRLLNHYDIWEYSHYYENYEEMKGAIRCYTEETTPWGADPHRDEDENGTEDECEAAGKGSRCDTFKQMCTLPFQDREPAPMVWYHSQESNRDPIYFEATDHAVNDWDVAMRHAVQVAKYAECQRVGEKDCKKKYPAVWEGQMDDAWDAILLTREIDACRHGYAHDVTGSTQAERQEGCAKVAEQIGQKRGYSKAVIEFAKLDEMVLLCHSPVTFDDPEACAPADERMPQGYDYAKCQAAINGTEADATDDDIEACKTARVARMGDLRYHMVNNIETPQTPSPWGIMVSAIDPTSGQVISTSANVWTWVNDYISQLVIDQLRLIKGAVTIQEITGMKNPEVVNSWGETEDGQVAETASAWRKAATNITTNGGVFGKLSRAEVSRRMSSWAFKKEDLKLLDKLEEPPAASDLQPLSSHVMKSFQEIREMKAADVGGQNRALYEARMKSLRGTPMEAELMTPAIQQLAGVQNLDLNENVLNLASPLRAGNPTVQREMQRTLQNALHKRGIQMMTLENADEMAQIPLSLAGFADIMEEKFGSLKRGEKESVDAYKGRLDKMRNYMSYKIQYGVITHEIGHSISHRHQFVSSSDAWSFRPQYWQLRTKDGAVNNICSDLSSDGEDCVGPRYWDPVTKNEEDNLIWMFQNSSVMDYGGDILTDFLGIGGYDLLATRMFYGQTLAVHASDDYKSNTDTGSAVIGKIGGRFGGILGIQYSRDGDNSNPIHYSELQKEFELISDCQAVNADDFKPWYYDEDRDGNFHPVVDALIVKGDGKKYTKCRQQPVDYVTWNDLRMPTAQEAKGFYMEFGCVDKQGRTRLPQSFASDEWADLGNASVYRHDNGADVYEIFNFLISKMEMEHVFDNYRRNRTGFSVRSGAGRAYGRYNAKVRDGAKGLGLYRSMIEDGDGELGMNNETMWRRVVAQFGKGMQENIIASGMVFDHFARELARPQSGVHYSDTFQADLGEDSFRPEGMSDKDWEAEKQKYAILRSASDTGFKNISKYTFNMPDGAYGDPYGNISSGGRIVENQLADDKGDFDREYTMNVGSYYNKIQIAGLLSESADNFISDSRGDFVDPRYRSVSLAALFPEGFRRLMANALTGDDWINGPRVAAKEDRGAMRPLVIKGTSTDPLDLLPTAPIGWTSWWGEEPKTCFPNKDSQVCRAYHLNTSGNIMDPGQVEPEEQFGQRSYDAAMPIEPQIGWEQQKFLVIMTFIYLLENEKDQWSDMMRIWELGSDSDPGFENRIEFHHPTGRVFIAKTYGKEQLFGKTVQKGIAARVLEWANTLLKKAYEVTEVDYNGDGVVDWYKPVINNDGKAKVQYDPAVLGDVYTARECNATSNEDCECDDNRYCLKLRKYEPVVSWIRDVSSWFSTVRHLDQRGIYDF